MPVLAAGGRGLTFCLFLIQWALRTPKNFMLQVHCMNSTTLFSQTPPVRLFFLASLPGAVSMLASSLYQLIDGVFVGNFLTPTAFAALNLAMPFVIINFSLADLVGVGSSVPISVALGQGDRKLANNIFTSACILIISAGAVMGAAMFAAAPFLIGMMGAEGEFAVLAVQYLRTYAVCSPFTTILYAVDNYLRISGYIRGSMFLNILMSVLCAGFEFLFLGVFGWGIWASAAAASLGMFICVVLAFIPFVRGRALLHFVRPRITGRILRQIVACGSPSFLNNIAGRITSILMNLFLVRLGGELAVSVYGVLMYVEGFIQPLMYGMCDSLQPAVGFNWGAGKFSRVRAIEKCCFAAAAAISLVSAALIALAPGPITLLFLPDADGAALAMGVGALRVFALTYLTRWLSFATQSYMLAVEKALAASVISVVTALVCPVGLLAALWPLGLEGLWANFPATSALAAALALVILRRERPALTRPGLP